MTNFILCAIDKVLNAINKSGSEEEKRIANELVGQFEEMGYIPTEKIKPFFYFNEKKGEVGYVYGNDRHTKRSIVSIAKKDKFNKYVGASLAYGNAEFGSKTKFHKHLAEMYGCDFKKDKVEQYALIYYYNRYNGKAKFEEFVDNNSKPKNIKAE